MTKDIHKYRMTRNSVLFFTLFFTKITFSQEIDFTTLENLLEKEFKPLILTSQKYAVSVVSEIPSAPRNVVSGFIVDAEGIVITRKSVIQDLSRSNVSVILSSGESLQAQILGFDDLYDFAILKVEPFNFETPNFAQLNSEKIGNWVFVMRNSLGFYKAVSMAYVSSYYENGIFQISTKIDPGIFGSPVFNSQGQVVGLLAAKVISKTDHANEQPLREDEAVVIPMAHLLPGIKKIVDQSISNENWIGLTIFGYPTGKSKVYRVTNVFDNSPAAEAGIRLGDEIISVNGQPISNLDETRQMIQSLPRREIVEFMVKRKHGTLSAKVEIGTKTISYGMTFEPLQMKKTENKLEQALGSFPASPGNLLLLQKSIDQFLRGKFKP